MYKLLTQGLKIKTLKTMLLKHTIKSIAKRPWGLGRACHLLTLIYNIVFFGLFHFNKVLKIQAHDITVHSNRCLELRLPYRKTSQFEGICK